MKLGHGKSDDWVKAVRGLAAEHQQPNDLAPLVDKLHAATDTYIARKKNLTTFAQRDEALHKLMGSLGHGPAHALGQVACIHRLSPEAATRVVDEHWDRLGDCLGAEMEVEEALSIQDAILTGLHDDDGRRTTDALLAAWKLHHRMPLASLKRLASYLQALPESERSSRANTLVEALFNTWMGAYARTLKPAQKASDVAAAAECVKLVTRADSGLALAWAGWVPNVAHVSVYTALVMDPATREVGSLLLAQEGPDSTTPPTLRSALVTCARDAASDPALRRLLVTLCRDHAVTQGLILLMREAQALRGRGTVDIIVGTLQGVQEEDALASLASLQGLAAALAHEPRWAMVAQAVAPYVIPSVYNQVKGLIRGFPDTTPADTLVTCANRLQGARPLLTEPQPNWLPALFTWQPNVARLHTLEKLRRTAPAPARAWLREVLRDFGPEVPRGGRNAASSVRIPMAETLLKAAGAHQELMLQVCALPGCDEPALQRIATYDADNVTAMAAALRKDASEDAVYGGVQAMHALWKQGPCEPLATRWQRSLADGALIRQLLASKAYVTLNGVAGLLRWVAPEAPANATVHSLWAFQVDDLKTLQTMARGCNPAALWAEALVAYAVHPSYAPASLGELGDAFVKSARAWLVKNDAETTRFWTRLVPVADASKEAVTEAMMLARRDDPAMREQLLAVLDAPANINVGWRLLCLMECASSDDARPTRLALRNLAARLNLADALTTSPPCLLRSEATGLGLMKPVIDAHGRTRDASEVGAQDSTVLVDRLTERLLRRWESGDDNNWERLLAEEARCPITGQPMEEPVVASDGQCYEKAALAAWRKLSPVAPDGDTPLDGEPRPHLGLAYAQHLSDERPRTAAHGSNASGAHPWLAGATHGLVQDIAELRQGLVDLSLATLGLDVDDTPPDTLDALMQVLDTFEARINVHEFERIALPADTVGDETTAQRLWRQADARHAAAAFLLTRPLDAWKHLVDEVGHEPELVQAFADAALLVDDAFLALQALNLGLSSDQKGFVAAAHANLAAVYGREEEGPIQMPAEDYDAFIQVTVVKPAVAWNGIGPLPSTLEYALSAAAARDPNDLLERLRNISPALERLLSGAPESTRLVRSLWLAAVGLAAVGTTAPVTAADDDEPFTCAICTDECTPQERAHLTHCTCSQPTCVNCTVEAVRTTESTKGIDHCPTLCGGALTRGDLERLGMDRDEVETRMARVVAAHLQNKPNWRPCTEPDCDGGCVVSDPNASVYACGLCGEVSGDAEDDALLEHKLLEGFAAFDVAAHRNGNGIYRECFHCAAPTLKGERCVHMTCSSRACGKDWDFVRGTYYQGTDWIIDGTEQLYRPHKDGILAKLGVYHGINRGVLTERERGIVKRRIERLLKERRA